MSSEISIKVENLSKCYQIYEHPRDRLKQFIVPRLQRAIGQPPRQYFREFWALRDVSFEIQKGETVGIIGRNGSGKSTLLQMICGTLNPTGGSIQTHGRIAALLELGSGFNPEFSGRENVYMNAAVLGLSTEEVDNRFDAIAAFADIGEFIEQPVKTYSSGMFVRLAFAVNIMSTPEIMIVDEALAVGDMAFQAKCMTALTRIQEDGATVLFVSHDIGTVKSLCTRAVYLEHGAVRAKGKAPNVADLYVRTMREEMNAEHQKFNRVSKSSEISKEETIGSDLAEVKANVVFPRSEDFDQRVAAFRYGSGEARISYVEMLGLDGQPLSIVDFNQEVKINIFFECLTEKQDVGAYFAILDEKRNPITGAGMVHIGQPLINLKEEDRFLVSFSLKLPLEAGNYSLMAQLSQKVISDISAEFIDVVENAIVFSVRKWNPYRIWTKVYLFPQGEVKKFCD